MKYFLHIKDLDDLKAEFRRLAMEHHPDKGGSVEIMQEINAEFESLFNIYKARAPKTADTGREEETASSYRKEFYTANGWAGSRYDRSLSLKEIAKIVREYVKNVYPTWRFSIRCEFFSMGSSFHVSLMEGPKDIFIKEKIHETAVSKVYRGYGTDVEQEYQNLLKDAYERGYYQNAERIEFLTEEATAVIKDVERLVESYNYRDCDSQVDYFDVNFYTHYYIGRWDKPFKIVPRTARITPSQGDDSIRRIAG